MSKEKKPLGRPKLDNPASKRLAGVRVTPDQLTTYKRTAKIAKISLSEWVRAVLDKACK